MVLQKKHFLSNVSSPFFSSDLAAFPDLFDVLIADIISEEPYLEWPFEWPIFCA